MKTQLLLAATLTIAAPLPALAAPTGLAPDNPIQQGDIWLLKKANSTVSPSGDVVYGFLSNSVQLIATPLVASYVVSGYQWGAPVQVLESQAVTGVAVLGLKAAFQRPRPFVSYPGELRLPYGPEPLYSFPSGHAMMSFAGATTIAINQPAWAVPAYAWAGLVCYSRLYAGVHYPTDVLSGAAIGVGTAYLANWLFSGLNTRLGVAPAAASPTVMPLTWSTGF